MSKNRHSLSDNPGEDFQGALVRFVAAYVARAPSGFAALPGIAPLAVMTDKGVGFLRRTGTRYILGRLTTKEETDGRSKQKHNAQYGND